MIPKEFLTTGEASKLLNISRSTVSRNFDKEILHGQRNPITGERLISWESLVGFMKQYDLPLDPALMAKRKILLGTSDEQTLASIQKILSGDGRVQMERVPFGSDVLFRCPQEHPDLLIIDEELPDIPSSEVIKSLRRRGEQKDLKILCLAKTKNTQPCLEWGANEALPKEGLEEQAVEKKIYGLLEISATRPLESHRYEHQRRWPRVSMNLPAKIGVYSLNAPQQRDSGKALLQNISCGGAYLSQIRLENEKIPAQSFRLLLEVDEPPLKNLRAHCKIVRLQSNGTLTMGVQFVRLSKANRAMIEEISLG